MAIRDVLIAAGRLKEAFDQLEQLQDQRDRIVSERQRLTERIDAQQLVVDERRAALKTAAATL